MTDEEIRREDLCCPSPQEFRRSLLFTCPSDNLQIGTKGTGRKHGVKVLGIGADGRYYLPTRIPAQWPPNLPENERSPKAHLNNAFCYKLLFRQIISLTLLFRRA